MAQQFQNPFIGPDLQKRQYQMQQNQRYAQMLMEQGQQQPQGQIVSGHYVAPSITQHLANALKTYTGRRVADDMPNQLANLQRDQMTQQQSLFGLGGYGNSPSRALDMGAQKGDLGPTNTNAQRMGDMLAGQPQMPLLPGRSAHDSWLAYSMMGPEKYMELVSTQGAPTREQKNLDFLPQDQRNSLIAAPYLNEAGKDGTQMVLGPNGQVQAFEVPGYRDIQAANAGAVAGAQAGANAQYEFTEVPMPDGSTRMMPTDMAASTLRGNGEAGGGIGTKTSESVLNARTDLPNITSQFDQIENTINSIVNHPGLEAGTGLSSYLPSVTGNARDFDALSDQLQGQVFLQAYESLKGGGVITDFEGAKAEQALARSQKAQTKEAYVDAMNEFLDVIRTAKARAYEKARVPMPAQEGARTQTGDRSQQLDSILGF